MKETLEWAIRMATQRFWSAYDEEECESAAIALATYKAKLASLDQGASPSG